MFRHYSAAVAAVVVAACSASGGNTGAGQGGGSLGGAPGASGAAPPVVIGAPPGDLNGAGGGLVFGNMGVSGAAGNGFMMRIDLNCVADVHQGEQLPLDIYVMFDVSCSMSCPSDFSGAVDCCPGDPNPRMTPVRSALEKFLESQGAGVEVGLGYFGMDALGQTSCDPNHYSTPAVPIAPLPQNTQALEQSLNQANPTGETPTGAAIRGACTVARGWVGQNPGHVTVILLVTDGNPEAPLSSVTGTCSPTLPDAQQAATDCAGQQPQVPTYVLGIGNLANLNQIAQAGGTQQAYLVDPNSDVAAQVLDALNKIRTTAQVPCQFKVPTPPNGETFKKDYVNIEFTDPSGTPVIVYNVGNPNGCDPVNGGWYYDNDQNPQSILLCPATCTTVTTRVGYSVNVALGCVTKTPPA